MKGKDYKAILQLVTQNINEGIYIVRADGMSMMYNDRMSKLEEMRIEDVIGKNVKEVQSHIPDEESTLMKALKYKITTPDYHQTFINQYGKEITTINTTVPVINENGEVIAAVEIAKDVTEIKEMSNTILDLQSEAINTAKFKNKEIKTYTFENLIGSSENFSKVLDKCKRASKVTASVLIYGETGTGKELIAQSIHNESDRKGKPFLAQNCAALPESLLEGILFGTSKGGFTGAIDREGLFEQANGGTLLLDEISAMPYDLQSKLLRVLQENYIRRVGGTKDIPIDVRIIATINEKAEDLIINGKLRQDLYYRLKIIEINVPPLRERKSDILPLIEYFLKKYSSEFKKHIKGISDKGKELLINYEYPGNIRELEHIIMSIISMSEDEDFIKEDQLELPINTRPQKKVEVTDNLKDLGLEKYIDNIEKAIIIEAVENSGGFVSKAAKQLGLKRQTLQYKLRKYGIQACDDTK
ncbi:sigma-54 interaction domain-containing protein [Sinanaerobacter chloroacetimidivorans]|uniref:Sigma 54-interacting transcriptional regulator n=1 Tax=Sinanaerobacter chloroacetimidivorans TaxID=2818044 RepID=A0A8J7W1T8_9FIRM|nr:sigma 54-interacting transcriptional regulator [Sinanaerobacter chloroacetimidivorans]MBR0598836.1 sigma 54-interacting transcriptional regulator [Sinanaerobacter chloroacetimidivorans]